MLLDMAAHTLERQCAALLLIIETRIGALFVREPPDAPDVAAVSAIARRR